ncbi:MAG: sialidase family protein [Planctomycetota bacterium]
MLALGSPDLSFLKDVPLLVVLLLPLLKLSTLAEDKLATGELAFANVQNERPMYLRLVSGKLFRVSGECSETSSDDGASWVRGGRINPYGIGGALSDSEIQLQSGTWKGRILVPYYLEMDGDHPDYSREQRGGYAVWKGEKILLETHTHVPEMAGSFMCYSDNEGATWNVSKGFLMGYFEDGRLGHWSCEEPVVAELKDGRVVCFMRSTCGRILKSCSSDGGVYWTKVKATDLAMSNSPCALARIPATGDLVLVWNRMSADEIRRGYRRGRLSIAISKDDAQTWENIRTLELSPGIEDLTRVEPPDLTAMVRGSSGPDAPLGEVPDGFTHFHYPNVYFSDNKIFIKYLVSTLDGKSGYRWRVFPISWLYAD